MEGTRGPLLESSRNLLRGLHFLLSFEATTFQILTLYGASQVALVVKNPPANAGHMRDMGLIPGLGSSPGRACSHMGRQAGMGVETWSVHMGA